MKPANGFEVDPDAFAETLRNIAEAYERREASIRDAGEEHDVVADDASEHEIRFRFVADRRRTDLFNAIQYDTIGYLRFADRYAGPILNGHKTATLRVDFTRDVSAGDAVELVDTSGDKFAETTIDRRFDIPIHDVPVIDVGHYGNMSVSSIVDTLRTHYGEDVDGDTVVTAFEFGEVEAVNGYKNE